MSDGLGVGYGARPTADGNDAVYLVAQENFPSEFLDFVFPVRVTRYAINPDTGGPGRWRGGCGLVRELEVLAPEAMVSMRIDSVEHPPWGVAGGHAAGTGRCIVNPGRPGRAHPAAARATATSSSAATSCASRPAAAAAGAIPSTASPSACWPTCAAASSAATSAEEHYGVVLTADGASVDLAATERRRARAAGGQALPSPRLPRGAGVMAKRRLPRARHRRHRHGRHLHRRDAARPGHAAASGPPRRRRRRTIPRRASATASPRCLKVSGLTGADIARVLHGTTVATNLILEGKGAPRRAHHHRRLQVRAGDRPPGRAAPRQPVRLGEAQAPGAARAHLRGRRPHRARRRASSHRSTRPPCARPPRAIRRKASARSPSCCCTATPTPRTSDASPRSSPRRSPARCCRCRARCCRCSASTSAA